MWNLDKSLQWAGIESGDIDRLTGHLELSQPYAFGWRLRVLGDLASDARHRDIEEWNCGVLSAVIILC